MSSNKRVILLGGAGLVGQNLTIKLIEAGYRNVLVVDKSSTNLGVLRELHPEVETCLADISENEDWASSLSQDDIIVMLQAQIGGLHFSDFERNNIYSLSHI
jgi:nucleoside-diphosphate-sugar epimerase